MKAVFTVLGVLLISFQLKAQTATNSMIGRVIVEAKEGKLSVYASFKKEAIVFALTSKGECPQDHLLSTCAEEYIKSHINLKVNGFSIILQKTSQTVEHPNLEIFYEAKMPQVIHDVSVESHYMQGYEEGDAKIEYTILVGEDSQCLFTSVSHPVAKANFPSN